MGFINRLRSLSLTLVGVGVLLSGCTETQYVAHLAKQIPFPTDTPKTTGYYKVGNPYEIKGRQYRPQESFDHVETGIASWYGPNFHGKKTANGEIFNENELTAAHRTLQMPSLVRVTNLENGKSLILRVNDRGPFAHDRVIDVSKKASELLGFRTQGTAKVRVEVIPEESKILAEIAKQRESTAGLEIAMNRTGRLPSHLYQYSDQNSLLAKSNASAPQNAQTKQISSANNSANNNAQPQMTDILDQYSSRNVNVAHNVSRPQPIIETQPMNNIQTASGSPVDVVQQQSLSSQIPVNQGNLYVQAGSFSSAENAQALKAALGEIGDVNVQVANIQGRTFHRVRIGPFDTISNADQAMVALEQKGRNGTIVIVD